MRFEMCKKRAAFFLINAIRCMNDIGRVKYIYKVKKERKDMYNVYIQMC